MAFKQDTCIDDVDLGDSGGTDIVDESRKKKVEMFPSSRSSVNVMVWSNAKEVINIWFQK